MTEPDFASVTWRKSSHSGGASGQCVEVASLPGLIGIRDSKNPDGPKLAVHLGRFRDLVRHLRSTE
ncbi:DUF397 domain-containing protein [Actinocorallia aurantiaca]|uniref:DUF397 domain-containing protein n=1 Tax=Actinocorallia aurantiaca TaxID=46204 RepID=A0ABN3USW6_9ACTN